MSTTGTRPPLFDPEPGSFDDDVDAPAFPHRPGAGRHGSGRSGAGADTSPRWVRPFLLGGLVLVAMLSLLTFLGEGAEQPTTSTAPPVSDIADPAADGAAADAVDLETAADDPADDAPAASADLEVATTPDPAVATADLPDGGPVPAADGADDLAGGRAFAAQFAHDYLNLDEADPQVRQNRLRAYLAPGLDPQLGWDGTGTQVAVLTIPVDLARSRDGITVTVAAQVTGRDAPRWVHLAVPLAQDARGRWAVVAPPAYVPRPRAGAPELAAPDDVDTDLAAALQPAVQSLFAAYATDEVVDIEGVTLPDSTIHGLDGQVALVAISPVVVERGDGPERTALVEVTWDDEITQTTLTQRYQLQLVDDDGSWLVSEVTAR